MSKTSSIKDKFSSRKKVWHFLYRNFFLVFTLFAEDVFCCKGKRYNEHNIWTSFFDKRVKSMTTLIFQLLIGRPVIDLTSFHLSVPPSTIHQYSISLKKWKKSFLKKVSRIIRLVPWWLEYWSLNAGNIGIKIHFLLTHPVLRTPPPQTKPQR